MIIQQQIVKNLIERKHVQPRVLEDQKTLDLSNKK